MARASGLPPLSTLLTLLSLLPLLSPPAALTAQEGADPAAPDTRITRLEERLASARDDLLPLLAPEPYREAERAYREALRLERDGAERIEVLAAADRAEEALRTAREAADRSRELLATGLAARREALRAGGPERAPALWSRAEEALARAGEAAGSRDPEEARRRAANAADLYRDAHRTAVRTEVLGEAREARRTAMAREAGRRAPRSLAVADSLLARAEATLETTLPPPAGGLVPAERPGPEAPPGEATRQGAAARADSARRAYRAAARLAALVDSVRDADAVAERALREREARLARVADSLGLEVDPSDGTGPETTRILEELAARHRRRSALEARLDSALAAGAALGARADSLAGALDALKLRLADVFGRLERRLERERQLRELEALFGPEEARVLVRGDTVRLRLVGLRFATGSDELPPSADPLLVKVQAAIRAFPGAEIGVEGHTDSQGDEERNRVLSLRRAIAVRDRLLTALPISADRMRARGAGETEPIATNDTEEGRALNRRIEIVLVLPPGSEEG